MDDGGERTLRPRHYGSGGFGAAIGWLSMYGGEEDSFRKFSIKRAKNFKSCNIQSKQAKQAKQAKRQRQPGGSASHKIRDTPYSYSVDWAKLGRGCGEPELYSTYRICHVAVESSPKVGGNLSLQQSNFPGTGHAQKGRFDGSRAPGLQGSTAQAPPRNPRNNPGANFDESRTADSAAFVHTLINSFSCKSPITEVFYAGWDVLHVVRRMKGDQQRSPGKQDDPHGRCIDSACCYPPGWYSVLWKPSRLPIPPSLVSKRSRHLQKGNGEWGKGETGGNLGNGRGNSRTGTSVDGRYRRAKQGQLLPVSRPRLALGRVGTSTRGASTAFKEPQIPPGVEATDSRNSSQGDSDTRRQRGPTERSISYKYRQHSTQQPIASRQHLTQPSSRSGRDSTAGQNRSEKRTMPPWP
ncbi:predicted protein [Histoplasma capsulatum G186AR]|uniref:Uncharacterized protein n=1 Tax=Ajellomyces capsulatus (strain G186AR / H82 / ATCC MYA-2454 / RMSCC 2432) TaxID=447093 RepID=C0NYZ1_AJECG|nr:uncharacterized protein HCBG_08371 [Histoplasma capsulatum G186AR]EEH03431.1 predicted protein [Histoplasma capsulatum G186AR]